MAMDAALVAAYRSAKMANVPKDTIGAAMASLQDSLTEAAANIAASKETGDDKLTAAEKLQQIDLLKQGWVLRDGEWVHDQKAADILLKKYDINTTDNTDNTDSTDNTDNTDSTDNTDNTGGTDDPHADDTYDPNKIVLDDLGVEIPEEEPEVYYDEGLKDSAKKQWKFYKKQGGTLSFAEWQAEDRSSKKELEERKKQEASYKLINPDEPINQNQKTTTFTYKSAFHYGSPFHQNEENTEAQSGVSQEEIYASKEWKDKIKKAVKDLSSTPASLTQPMYEQQQIVINKTKEDAFGDNKYKIIEDTGGDPNILNEVFESGVLGDEEEAAALVEEYTKNKGLGLTVETMQKNKMAAAMSKISGLASNNEEHKQSMEMIKGLVDGRYGALSNFAEYDPNNEFYNTAYDYLNPESPAFLQEEGNFNVFSATTGQQLNPNMVDPLVSSHTRDAAGMTKVQESIDKFRTRGLKDGESPKPKNTLPSDGELFGSAGALVDSAENFVSWMHDDILGNNSSFANDLEQHPEFQGLAINMDPTKNTVLTPSDKLYVKDAIINPNNPFYNEDRSKALVKTYIAEYQKYIYKKNNKSIIPRDSKGKKPMATAESILEKYGINKNIYK